MRGLTYCLGKALRIRQTLSQAGVVLQDLGIYGEEVSQDTDTRDEYVQSRMVALLLGAPKLTSLSMVVDGVPWPPVLGLLTIRHLELTMTFEKPWLSVMLADLSLCACLETLKLVDDVLDYNLDTESMTLPDLFLHDVTTLKSVDLIGWYPWDSVTLPPGCLLRVMVAFKTQDEWHRWQRRGCPTSMLHLVCMKLRAWPAGLGAMSDLQHLNLHCKRSRDQDLAALQHIPHVVLEVQKFSKILLTSGSWQTLHISGRDGFHVTFQDVNAFVRDTEQFLLVCTSQEARQMYRVLRAACVSQGVACYECEHTGRLPDDDRVARLSNVKLCKASEVVETSGEHEQLLCVDEHWPSRAAYPELYS